MVLKAIQTSTRPIVREHISSISIGVVVSAGKMDRAVKVRVAGQQWHKKFRKSYASPNTHVVADPNNSLVEGDVVRIESGNRCSKTIRHVVHSIVAPFGSPATDRPPVLSQKERLDLRIKEKLLKDVRSATRGRQVSKVRLDMAKKRGYKIPSLEEAFRNVTLVETEEKASENDSIGAEVHEEQAGQVETAKERRREKGTETAEEKEVKE
ncbi:nucleic acid-binding protein [Polyplosphaeria fusca]|uniref:Nucleic acid-binding protein n=1 Tax=Polyplosphaeria fusca TaxID=682080 RepID=A0A9P4QR03_9PLEO|nr:nucleic acid-binding protein [Polyplosphaeria fusca]